MENLEQKKTKRELSFHEEVIICNVRSFFWIKPNWLLIQILIYNIKKRGLYGKLIQYPKAKKNKIGEHYGHWIIKEQNIEESAKQQRGVWLCD